MAPGPSMLRLPSSVLRKRQKNSTCIDKGSAKSLTREGFPPVSPKDKNSGTMNRKSMILAHKGSLIIEDAYSLASEKSGTLGAGGFGTVRRASLRSADSITRAVKVVEKAGKNEEYVHREIAILRLLDHPCICRLLETFEDRRHFYMVLELIDGRELFDEITEQRSLDEKRAMGIMAQVFNALQYCHERNVIHRDLKPENIMVQRRQSEHCGDGIPPEVKLIDFGLAVMCEDRSVRGKAGSRVAGSANYLAPEALRGFCTPASDVFSAGVVLHIMLIGCLPSAETLEGHSEGGSWDMVSPEAFDLVQGLLQIDPAARFTAAQAAGHKWTRGDAEISLSPELVSRMMRDFLSFHQSVKLQRAALTALAMQLTSQQLSEHRERFIAMDADGNGRISKEELVESIAKTAPLCADDVRDWAEKVFDSIDTDGSQEIEYTEWLATAMHENACLSEEAMQAAFRVFDLNGDGRIDPHEFAKVLMQTPQEVAPLLPQFDTDGINDDRERHRKGPQTTLDNAVFCFLQVFHSLQRPHFDLHCYLHLLTLYDQMIGHKRWDTDFQNYLSSVSETANWMDLAASRETWKYGAFLGMGSLAMTKWREDMKEQVYCATTHSSCPHLLRLTHHLSQRRIRL